MKFFASIIFLTAIIQPLRAQDLNDLFQEAKKSEIALNETEALDHYKQVLNIQPTNIIALARCSELAGSIGGRETDKEKKQEYLNAAQTYSETALQVNPNDPAANYARAAIAARLADLHSGKEKAENIRDMKKYADLSLQADPRYAKSLYILGRWHFEVSSLGGIEKTAAKLLYGGMPNASLDLAIQNFEKARAIDQFLVMDYLYLAKAYVKNHKSDKAIDVLNKMIRLPNRTQDDPALKAEGKKILAELQ